jgi:hypothetical protein
VASQPGATLQSPSTNCTRRTCGASSRTRRQPALRARAAVKGTLMSIWITSTPIERAKATESSVEPEST